MSDLIKTLKSSSTGDDVYPNIKEDNIPTGAVTSAKIGTSAVTTGKINDGAVTTNKVSDGAITYEKLALALKNLIDGKASNYDLSIVQSALNTHIANTSNPHSVTKAQVGLGNVDNTSDANKPVSTATQGALDLKADKSTTYTKTEVDTALSGKASLSGDNTFTGDNTHSGSEYFNSTIECNANDIYFVDESKNFADWMNDKQNKLYLHYIRLYVSNSNNTDMSIIIRVINDNNNQINSIELLSQNESKIIGLDLYDDSTEQASGNSIISFTGIDVEDNTTINFYYNYIYNGDVTFTNEECDTTNGYTIRFNDSVFPL